MAALPYIKLYVADYLADTMHLDAEEHGAYLLIIFNYWQTGGPVLKSRLRAIARVSNERWPSVEQSLAEYFNDTGTHWQHDRLDEDLVSVKSKQSIAVKAGKASAKARREAKKAKAGEPIETGLANGRSTVVANPLQRNVNHIDTDTDTDTDTEKDKPLLSPSATNNGRRGSRLPNDWKPNLEAGETVRKTAGLPSVNLKLEADKFRDYWRSQPGAKGCKLDWDATWRNWVRSARGDQFAKPEPVEQHVRGTRLQDLTL